MLRAQAAGFAAGALAVMAVHGVLRAEIARCGAIGNLARMVGSRNLPAAAKCRAAGALRNLACGSPQNAAEAVDAGAIPPLVGMLSSDLPELVGAAAAALGNLAYNSPANIEAVRAQGGVERLQVKHILFNPSSYPSFPTLGHGSDRVSTSRPPLGLGRPWSTTRRWRRPSRARRAPTSLLR